MRAGLRRLLAVVLAVTASTAVVSLLFGLLVGSEPLGAISTGFYIVGSFALVAGVAVGMRGPTRPARTTESEPSMSVLGLGVGARGARRATTTERREAISLAWLLLALGALLIVLGILADTGVDLV